MTMKRIQRNWGWMLAGAVLCFVVANVYYEINSDVEGVGPCQCTSTR